MQSYGLIPQPGSGSGEIFKEDGRSERILCQLKSSEGKCISFRRHDVLGLIKNAGIAHKKPVFIFDFVSENEDLIFMAVRPFDMLEIAKEFQKLKLKGRRKK